MPYLLDTNALSDLIREHQRVQERLRQHAGDRVFTSVIVRGELLFGVERLAQSKRRSELELKITQVLAAIDVEPVPVAAAEHYANLKSAAQRRGAAVDENDLWIAATARQLQATVVTRDHDFQRLAGVSLVDWTA